MFGIGEPATIFVPAETTDDFGDEVLSGFTEWKTIPVLVEPVNGAEGIGPGRDQTPITFRIYSAYGSGVTEDHEVEVRGVRCKVNGRPEPWTYASGEPAGDRIYLSASKN